MGVVYKINVKIIVYASKLWNPSRNPSILFLRMPWFVRKHLPKTDHIFIQFSWSQSLMHLSRGWISLDPRPIRLQLNAWSPTRPGIDCIWAWSGRGFLIHKQIDSWYNKKWILQQWSSTIASGAVYSRKYFPEDTSLAVATKSLSITLLLMRMAAETPLLFRLLTWSIMSLLMRDTRGETINKNKTFVNRRSLGPT